MHFRFPLLYPLLTLLVPLAVNCRQIAPDTPEAPDVSIEWEGRSSDNLDETITEALNLRQVQSLLNGTKHRVLLAGFQSEPANIETTDDIFEAAIYDYTNGRSILLSGVPFDPATVSVTEANIQPPISSEELAEAGSIAGACADEIVTDGMPSVITNDFPNGTSHRILNVSITGKNSSRVALVNMNNGTVESIPSQLMSLASCSAPLPATGSAAGRRSSWTRNDPSTQSFTTKDGLWTFQAVRPARSSGRMGSGIELRHVNYKNKLVLARAHVPILNVEYDEKDQPGPLRCGPYYRDWQNEEYPFRCTGPETPGFKECESPARTILDDPPQDGGDFTGVASYYEGEVLVLKSQLKAGWYRYVSEWRFHPDGTLLPRFGFAAVSQALNCVCKVHNHHVYWRFDFDIITSDNNLVREFNNGPLPNYEQVAFEVRRPKDASRQRKWEISNTRTGDAYSLIPGTNDGTSDSHGVGDFWVVRFNDDELDDGATRDCGSNCFTKANIDKFVTGERVVDTDVVTWYGAHFRHDEVHHNYGASPVVGPTISPVKW